MRSIEGQRRRPAEGRRVQKLRRATTCSLLAGEHGSSMSLRTSKLISSIRVVCLLSDPAASPYLTAIVPTHHSQTLIYLSSDFHHTDRILSYHTDRPEEGEHLLERALAIRMRLLGADHPATLETRSLRAVVRAGGGRWFRCIVEGGALSSPLASLLAMATTAVRGWEWERCIHNLDGATGAYRHYTSVRLHLRYGRYGGLRVGGTGGTGGGTGD